MEKPKKPKNPEEMVGFLGFCPALKLTFYQRYIPGETTQGWHHGSENLIQIFLMDSPINVFCIIFVLSARKFSGRKVFENIIVGGLFSIFFVSTAYFDFFKNFSCIKFAC
jgi:hypothetical protein